ncbi:unnamed protein product [Lepidochelys kempii]
MERGGHLKDHGGCQQGMLDKERAAMPCPVMGRCSCSSVSSVQLLLLGNAEPGVECTELPPKQGMSCGTDHHTAILIINKVLSKAANQPTGGEKCTPRSLT